jgi:hypothetical protein
VTVSPGHSLAVLILRRLWAIIAANVARLCFSPALLSTVLHSNPIPPLPPRSAATPRATGPASPCALSSHRRAVPPLKSAPSTISSRHHHGTPYTEPLRAAPRGQPPSVAPQSSSHRGDLCLDPAVLVDPLASGHNHSFVPPPSFPAAQLASPWRSHPVSFFVPLPS